MAQTAVFQTYGDLTIKTDIVLDSVEIISAREDGIFAMLGKTNAIAMIHSYPVDTLKIVIDVYKSFLIDLEAVMLTGANLVLGR